MTTITPPQHMQALEHANTHRLAATDLKREVRRASYPRGREMVAALLEQEDLPPEFAHIRAEALLTFPRRMGMERARRTMSRAGVPWVRSRRRLRELTHRERLQLAGALREDS